MKIGELVKKYIPKIFNHCKENPAELPRLMSLDYSKEHFGLQYPFCREAADIPLHLGTGKQSRYWSKKYPVCGKLVRVTNHWHPPRRQPQVWRKFALYLATKRIVSESEKEQILAAGLQAVKEEPVQKQGGHGHKKSSGKGRYRVAAVGDSRADIDAYSGDAAQTDEDVQTVLNRIKRDIAWLENRLTIPPQGDDDNYDGGGDAKDYTQFDFNGISYNKRRLAFAVLSHWVEANAPANIYELNKAFPQNLTGVGGDGVLLLPLHKAQEVYDRTGHFRHVQTRKRIKFVRVGDGGKYAVSSEWKPENIRAFINNARRLGYDIKAVK